MKIRYHFKDPSQILEYTYSNPDNSMENFKKQNLAMIKSIIEKDQLGKSDFYHLFNPETKNYVLTTMELFNSNSSI